MVVGLGDETLGARVPVHDAEDNPTKAVRYLTYRGQEVWSKLNALAIRSLADAGDGGSDLGTRLDRLVSGTPGKPALPRTQGFWIPLLLAALCLAGGASSAGTDEEGRPMTPLLLILLAAGPAQNLVTQGNTAMRERRYQEAVQLYQQALALRPDSPEAYYGLGGAFYRLGDYTRALDSFEHAARLRRKGPLAAQARYNSGNCLFHFIRAWAWCIRIRTERSACWSKRSPRFRRRDGSKAASAMRPTMPA